MINERSPSLKVIIWKFFKRHLPNSDIKIGLIFLSPIGFITYYIVENIIISALAYIFFFVIVSSFIAFSERMGQKYHVNIINSLSFLELQKMGFKIVTKNRYKGLFGNYKGYLFEIFYDWNRRGKSGFKNLEKAIVFQVYFKSPEYKSGKYNEKKIIEIDSRNKVERWQPEPYQIKFGQDKVEIENYDRSLKKKPQKFIERMNLIAAILEKEKLEPMEKENLLNLRKRYYHYYNPTMELFWYKDEEDKKEKVKKL